MSPEPANDDAARTILRPKQGKWWLLVCAAGAFTAGGVWLSAMGRPQGPYITALFAAAMLIAMTQLVPRASSLELRRDGFVVTQFFRRREYAWSAVGPFTARSLGSRALVVFDREERGTPSRGARWNSVIVGADDALPDTYGLDPRELASRMNAARSAALAR